MKDLLRSALVLSWVLAAACASQPPPPAANPAAAAAAATSTTAPAAKATTATTATPAAPAAARSASDILADAIKAAPKDGMAMGLAMKALAGQPVDSDDVKAAIAALRQ